jgi:hypothetical protein
MAQLFLGEIANSPSKASLIYSVKVSQVDDRRAWEAGFRGGNAHAHRELSHAGIAGDGRDNGQLTRLVADIVLHNQDRMRARHFSRSSRREINEVDISPPRELHLSSPSPGPGGQSFGCQGEERFGQHPIPLAYLGIEVPCLAKDFILMGLPQRSFHDLPDKGTAGQTGLLCAPVNPGQEGGWQAERDFGNGHVHTSFIPVFSKV